MKIDPADLLYNEFSDKNISELKCYSEYLIFNKMEDSFEEKLSSELLKEYEFLQTTRVNFEIAYEKEFVDFVFLFIRNLFNK